MQIIKNLNSKMKKLETELHQSNFKRQQIERLIQEKEKELSLTHFEYSNPKKAIADLNKQWQYKLDLQLMSFQRQEQLLIYKQEQIAELEKKITDLEQQLQQKDFYHKKDIDNLHLVIATLKDQIFQLENEDKRKSLPVIDQPNESSERNKKHASVIINKKRIQKVNFHEISLMLQLIIRIKRNKIDLNILELQLKLKLHEIPFHRLDQYIYSKSVKGCLTLSDLIETFKQQPFELNDEQATLVARFIIEPEQEEWIYYDLNCTNDIVISISIFKNLIKPYELFQYEEHKVLYTQLCQVMKQNQNKIVSYLQLQGDHCNIQEFKKALDYNDVNLSSKLDDLLMMKIYEQFKQLSKFKYSIIFDLQLIYIYKIYIIENKYIKMITSILNNSIYLPCILTDQCFKDYIAVQTSKSRVFVPHTAGRYQRKKFRKAQCPIVERLAGALMFHGRNTGKKVKAVAIIRHAFEIVHLLTGKNPLAVLSLAVQRGGAREDFTKVGTGGVAKQQAVDVAPIRRVNEAVHNLAKGVRESVFKKMKTIAEALADELIAASNEDGQKSYTIKKRDELEKVAKTNR